MSDSARVYAVGDATSPTPSLPNSPAPAPTPILQTVGVVIASVLLLAALAVAYLSGDKTMLNTVVVFILSTAGIVFNFQYGSSAGSQKKDAVLAAKVTN